MHKVYIETSVVSYYVGEISKNIIIAGHQASTRDFWVQLHAKIEPVISALVAKEASQGKSGNDSPVENSGVRPCGCHENVCR